MNKTIHNLIAAVAFFAIGAFWLIKSFAIKVSTTGTANTTARTFPQIVSVLIMIVAALLIVETVIHGLKARKSEPEESASEEQAEAVQPKESIKRFIGVAVVFVVAVLQCVFIDTLTYLPTTIVLMAVVAWCFEIRKPLPLVLISVITPTALYVVFHILLAVPLP